jgi:hypothetical protein
VLIADDTAPPDRRRIKRFLAMREKLAKKNVAKKAVVNFSSFRGDGMIVRWFYEYDEL